MCLSMLCPTPPYETWSGSVGDLINESYHVLFVNDIHCLMFKSPTKLNLGGEWDVTLIGTLCV